LNLIFLIEFILSMKYNQWKIKSEIDQVNLLLKVTAFFWAIMKLWTYKKWIADRLYPVIPTFDFLENIPGFVHSVLFCLSLVFLSLIFLKQKKRLIILLFLSSEVLSCLLDVVRWQPWEYMYLCIFGVILINYRKPKSIIILIHLFLVSMYLFSGLHKMNRVFLNDVWVNTILIDLLGISFDTVLKYKLFFIGLIIPFFEVLFAGLLLFSKNKKKISFYLIAIHLAVLIILGPFGLNFNSVIWFWNLALIFVLIILYNKAFEITEAKNILSHNFYWLILWFVMPVFSFFGRWYQYLSFNLYSGKGEQMYIYFLRKDLVNPEFGSITLYNHKPSVNLHNWAMKELNSAPIPEMEVYLKIGEEIKKRYGKDRVKIILYNSGNKEITEL